MHDFPSISLISLSRRFLSTSVGVRYLHEIEFIEREMEHWFNVSDSERQLQGNADILSNAGIQ